jgi:hypothetical protein
MIQAAPNAIIMTMSATVATIQESRLSMEEEVCSMNVCLRQTIWQIAAGSRSFSA